MGSLGLELSPSLKKSELKNHNFCKLCQKLLLLSVNIVENWLATKYLELPAHI